MNELEIRSLIRESFNKKLSTQAFGEEFDYILMESKLNEVDLDDIKGVFGSSLDFLGDNLGDAGINAFKQYLVRELFVFLRSAGFPMDPDSLFGSVVVNVIQNLEWTQIQGYLDPAQCEKTTEDILIGVQQGLVAEPVMNKIVGFFFGPEFILGGPFGSVIRELLNKKLEEMTVSIREPLKSFVCDHKDFDRLISDFEKQAGEIPVVGDKLKRKRLFKKADKKAREKIKLDREKLYRFTGGRK